MKYYSEVLNSYFNTEKECLEAEKNRKVRVAEDRQEAKENSLQKEKKEAAKKVEQAEAALSEAYDELQLAKQRAGEIMQEAKTQCAEMISRASKKVNEKEGEKLIAIRNFNERFGVYSKVYTGEKASKEMARVNNLLNNWFDFNTLSKYFGW